MVLKTRRTNVKAKPTHKSFVPWRSMFLLDTFPRNAPNRNKMNKAITMDN